MMQSIGQVAATLKAQQNNGALKQVIDQVFKDPAVQEFLTANQDQLTAAKIQRGYSKLYEYYHETRLQAAGKATVAPGFAPRLILSAGEIDVTYVPTAQLAAARQAAAQRRRLVLVNMPKFIRQASFDDFYMDPTHSSPSRQAAFSQAVDFVSAYLDPDRQQYLPGLYLAGSFGVGKTYLLGAIANELAQEGVVTTLVHFPSFAVAMKGAIADGTLAARRTAVAEAPVLMIDDIGADALSTWLRDDVLGVILEHRMQEELPTFFSANFTMAELEEHLAVDTQGNQAPLKARRIMERIRFLAREVPMNGNNLRRRS